MNVHIKVSVIIEIGIQIYTISLPANVHFCVRREVLLREQYVADQCSVFVSVVVALEVKCKANLKT